MIWALLALSCREAPVDSTPTDTGAEDFCADAPVVRWNNFGEGFMVGNCQGCHASTATERYGAPENVTFDTVDQVWANAGGILYTTTSDSPTMPPNGGVDEDDLMRLQWWLRCAPEGT
ncbi:MAG: hypothetical protein VX899_12060 [Myxococcota bacterium]|nr:hypothetical protein [Myxococcota bacterium]